MGFSKLLSVFAVASLVSTPIVAARQSAPLNPAASLAVAPMSKMRATGKADVRNDLLGLPVWAVLLAAAAVAAIVVVAADSGSDSP